MVIKSPARMDEIEELDWKSLSAPDKEELKAEIKRWLLGNYKLSRESCLSRDALYKHYVGFCQCRDLPPGNKSTLTLIIAKVFPCVFLRRIGRRKETKHYYCGIDVSRRSGSSKKVAQTRLLRDNPMEVMDTEDPQVENSGSDIAETSTLVKQTEQEELQCGTTTTNNFEKKWKSLSAAENEAYRATTIEWLENDFEFNPAMCLQRNTVYCCYVEFCREKNISPANQAIFGKLLQKKFPKTNSRRLGVRGDSKYYYMGIDILEESKFHAKVTADKIISTTGKPKISRAFNGPPVTRRITLVSRSHKDRRL